MAAVTGKMPRTASEVPLRANLLAAAPYGALSEAIGATVIDLKEEPLVGGMSGEMAKLSVTVEGVAEPLQLVLKTTKEGTEERSAALGTAREALFFLHFAPQLRGILPPGALPECIFAAGNMATGDKAIILELVKGGTDSGLAFGMGSPLNWKRGEAVLAAAALATPEATAASAFRLAARIHGKFWRDESLLDKEWLRGRDWYSMHAKGQADAEESSAAGESAFHASQKHIGDAWKATLRGEGLCGGVNWAEEYPALAAAVSASIDRVSWPAFKEACSKRPFTLVHGDFHPGNALLLPAAASTDAAAEGEGKSAGAGALDSSLPRTVLLDFEVVGIGSGPQDLGQYVISHMDPSLRAGCEERLLKAYHAEVLATATAAGRGDAAAADLTWEYVKGEYISGGIERWVWMFAVLTSLCPPDMVHFWAKQMSAFMTTHGVTKDNIGMPRV